MKIIESNKELAKEEIYFLTKAQDVMKMTDAVDQTMELESWCIYEDKNSDGEDVELFAKNIGNGLKIKAAGGISSFDDAEKFIELGASRLGTSRLVKIMKQS